MHASLPWPRPSWHATAGSCRYCTQSTQDHKHQPAVCTSAAGNWAQLLSCKQGQAASDMQVLAPGTRHTVQHIVSGTRKSCMPPCQHRPAAAARGTHTRPCMAAGGQPAQGVSCSHGPAADCIKQSGVPGLLYSGMHHLLHTTSK
jgi:hypothetical protein